MRGAAAHPLAVLVLATFFQIAPVQAQAPLQLLSQTSQFRPTEHPIKAHGGRLYFSQYDSSGNNYEVIAFDIADQSFESIARGPGARFIAQSDKYLVIGERGRAASPLVVIDRATGERLGRIALRHHISWAAIEGNRLVAVQGGTSAGYWTTAQALVLELPSLKVVKSAKVIGGNDVQLWKGQMLSLGYDLAAYDTELNEQFVIKLPERKRGDRASCAATWPLRVYADKAVIVANCGEILIYDLITRRLERTIPSYSHFYSLVVMDGLIFTLPTSEPRQRNNAHVYDLLTGQEVGILPLNGTALYAKGNRLLTVEQQFARPSPMELYSVDTSALRTGLWRTEQVFDQCREAEKRLTTSGDLYGAIDACRSTGVEALLSEVGNAPALVPVLRQYALWLSRTFDRARDAAAMLERLEKVAPDTEVRSALIESRLKARVFEGQDVANLSAEEQQTRFGQLLERGDRLPRARTKPIEADGSANPFHFSGDRVYVGRYGNGASVGVLDRRTFDEVARIPIMPDDQEYQDAVAGITADANHVFVSTEYRYEQAGRPNLFVVDRSSHNVIRKAHIKAGSSLVIDGGALLACACGFTTDQTCKAVDPSSFKTRDVPGKTCIENGPHAPFVISANRVEPGIRFVAITADYLVAQMVQGSSYAFWPRSSANTEVVFKGPARSLDWPASVDGNLLALVDFGREAAFVRLVDARAGTLKTLFGLPITRSRLPGVVLHKQALYVGLGRDLLVFDTQANRLQRFIKDFIPGGFRASGTDLDRNRIARLMIDQGRLIALTSNGHNSRIVDLADLAGR